MKKIKETTAKLGKEVKRNIATAISAAFALVIALVWNNAIKGVIDEFTARIGITGTGYVYTLISAVVVSIICVAGIMFFSRWSEKK